MKSNDLKPPMTVCEKCFETKQEHVASGTFCYCPHNQAGAFLANAQHIEHSWISISPMPAEAFHLWKAATAAGVLGSAEIPAEAASHHD